MSICGTQSLCPHTPAVGHVRLFHNAKRPGMLRAARCGQRDSNPHDLRHQILSLARLPITPCPHYDTLRAFKITAFFRHRQIRAAPPEAIRSVPRAAVRIAAPEPPQTPVRPAHVIRKILRIFAASGTIRKTTTNPMNIARENRDDQTALLRVTVAESDYAETVDKRLREMRRKANIPGFRPGMVPMGIINRMYRRGAVAETAYKVASDACFDYIGREKIDYVGDVMPSDEQGAFDFDNDTEHEFVFEIGLAPEIDIRLSDNDTVTRYDIEISDRMRADWRANFVRRFGRMADADEIAADDVVSATVVAGDREFPDVFVPLSALGEDVRARFTGLKAGDSLTAALSELYPEPARLAGALKVKESELADLPAEAEVRIDKIRRFEEPALDAEFFASAFPDGSVTDEAGLERYGEERIAADLARESDYLFDSDLRAMLLEKAAVTLPEDFLRRWLSAVNEGKYTEADVERDFPGFLEMMRWNVVQRKLVERFDIKASEEDLQAEARAMAAAQFAQYGMTDLPEEAVAGYASRILENRQEAGRLLDRVLDRRVLEAAAPLVRTERRKVTADELQGILSERAARRMV